MDQIIHDLQFPQDPPVLDIENNQKTLDNIELTNSNYYQSFEKQDLQKLQNLVQNYQNDNEKEEINQILIKVKVEIDKKTEECLLKDKNILVLQNQILQQEEQMQILVQNANDTIGSYTQQFQQELDLKETFLDNLREQNSRMEQEISSLLQGADRNLRNQLQSLTIKYNQSLSEIDRLNLDIDNLQTQYNELNLNYQQKTEAIQQFKNIADLQNIFKGRNLVESLPMGLNELGQSQSIDILNQIVLSPSISLENKQSNCQLGTSNEIEKQKEVINDLENKYKSSQQALYTVLNDCESLQYKLDRLESEGNEANLTSIQQFNEIQIQNEQLQQTLTQNQVRHVQNTQQLEENEHEIQNLRQSIESFRNTRDGLQFELKLKSQELVQYSQQTEQDSLKIKELSQKNSLLMNEIQILKNDLQGISQQNPQSEFDMEIVKQQCLLINVERQQLEEDIVVLTSQYQISQKENQKFLEQNRVSDTNVKDLQKKVEELQRLLEGSNARNKSLTQSSNSKQYLERIETLNLDKQNLQTKIDELYNKIEELNTQKSKDYFDNKEQLLQENSKLQSQVRDYQKQKATFEHAQKQLEYKEKKIHSLESVLDLQKINNSQRNDNSFYSQKQNVDETILQKQSVDESILLQLSNIIKDNHPQSNNFQELIFYQEKEQEYEQQIQVADQIIQRQNKEISELQVLLDKQRLEIQALNFKYQELFEKLEKNQILYSQKLSENSHQNELKDQQIQELQDQLKQILKNFDDKDRTYDLASTNRFELDKTRYDLNQLESALQYKTNSIQKLEEIIKQQEESHVNNASKDMLIQDLQTQLEKTKYALSTVNSDIKQLQQEKKNISSFLENKYLARQKELEAKVEDLEKNNVSIQKECYDSEFLESQLQDQYNENQKLIHQFNQEQQKHNNELNNINSEVMKKAVRIKELEDQLEQYKEKHTYELKYFEQQSHEIKKQSSEVFQAQAQLSENQNQISRLRQEKDEIFQQLKAKEQEVKDLQVSETKIEQKLIQKYKKMNQELNKEQEEIYSKLLNEHKQQITKIQSEKDKYINDLQRYFKQEIDKNIKEQEEVIQSIIEQNLVRDQRDKSEILSLKNQLAQKEKIIQKKTNQGNVLGTPDHKGSIQYQSDYKDQKYKYIKEEKKRPASKMDDQNSPVLEKEYSQKNENSFQVVNQSQYYQNQALDQMYSKCIQRSKNLLTKNEVLLNTLKQTHLSNQLGKQSPEFSQQNSIIIDDNNKSSENILKFSKDYLLNQSQNGQNSRILYQQYNTTKEDSLYLKQFQDRINSQQSSATSQCSQISEQSEAPKGGQHACNLSAYKQRSLSQNLGIDMMQLMKDTNQKQNEILIGKVTHQTPLRYTQNKQQNSNSKKSPNYIFSSPKYEGEKAGHLRQGRGRMWYNNGEVYEGEWKSDKRCGYGILRDTTGEIYNGDWDNDHYNGQGRLRNKNCEQFSYDFDFRNFDKLNSFWVSYSGEFRNHTLHGLGTLVLSNGEKFLGSFQGGKIHGEGTFYRRNGDIQVGFWQNNKFIGNL